ncbi:hypothetical protein DPMN_063967 [Dreissena polymorpha]|uniref:Uncharacterized protein n=1 Tax=Dreissena polymorpha TaxID=45954 RepID=A0A9D4HJN5_DREPO|nr:hypothetical protein DPMN_063967 [Dreissena polymorpha]
MLTTSLQKGNITEMVMLIWNALSDKAETVVFKEDNQQKYRRPSNGERSNQHNSVR